MKNPIILFLLVFTAFEALSQNALPTPSLLQIQKNQEDSAIILKWEAPVAQILGFVIEKKEGGGHWLIVSQSEPGEKYFIDTNYNTSLTCYRIRSFGNQLLSDYSNIMDCKNLTAR